MRLKILVENVEQKQVQKARKISKKNDKFDSTRVTQYDRANSIITFSRSRPS